MVKSAVNCSSHDGTGFGLACADVSILLIGHGHDVVLASSDLAVSGCAQSDLWPVLHHRRAGQVLQPLCPPGSKHPGPKTAFRKPTAVSGWAWEVHANLNLFTFYFRKQFLVFQILYMNFFIFVFLEPSASVTLSTPCWRDTCSASMAPTSWSACSSCEASCSWPSCLPRAFTSSTSTSLPFYKMNSAASCARASSVTSPGCLS